MQLYMWRDAEVLQLTVGLLVFQLTNRLRLRRGNRLRIGPQVRPSDLLQCFSHVTSDIDDGDGDDVVPWGRSSEILWGICSSR